MKESAIIIKSNKNIFVPNVLHRHKTLFRNLQMITSMIRQTYLSIIVQFSYAIAKSHYIFFRQTLICKHTINIDRTIIESGICKTTINRAILSIENLFRINIAFAPLPRQVFAYIVRIITFL